MTYVIAQPCVDLIDKACIEECPVDCIYEGNRMLYIHPDECVDCGACEPVCPVEAIFYEDDTPEQWKDYYKANVEFFDDLGSPGGAAKMGKIDKDHPLIAALPPQDPRALTRRVTTAAGPVSGRLPDFPWDRLAPYAETARAHPDGIVDLSVGTPVDPTPEVVRRALEAASDAPGYPLTHGTPELREAVVAWFARRGATGVDPAAVLPTIGSKELVAWLPTLLGLGPGDVVVHPEVAYPTYDVGARLAGATPVPADGLTSLGPQRVRLVWLNSPANPTGRVLPGRAPAQGRRLGPRARRGGRLRRVLRRARLGGVGRDRARRRSWTRGSAAAATRTCSRCARCRSGRTWRATGRRSSPVTRPWSPSCSRCAGTRA